VVAAYVLIQTESGRAGAVAVALGEVPGLSDVAATAGPYDVIVRAEAPDIDELARLVISHIQARSGVVRTLTCPVVHL
jgi:uncharacterized protein with GYD domain